MCDALWEGADLMHELVGDDAGHALLVVGGGLHLVEQEVVFPVGDQTPVFHGSRPEIWDSDLVCKKANTACA